MTHKPQGNGNLNKAFDHMRNNYKEKPKKSFYPFGHEKTIFVANETFRDNFDRIFGKNNEPEDYDCER